MPAAPRPSRLAVVPLTAIAALALAACGGGSSGGDGAKDASLTGTQWVLDAGALGVPGGETVTSWIRFQGGTATGNDGCNQLHGPYTVDGQAIKIGPLAGTRKLCTGPAQQVSDRVLAALRTASAQSIHGMSLRLEDEAGRVVLTYAASTPSMEGAWRATSVLYDNGIRSVIQGTELTADFAAGGHASGSGGCNSFSGTYTAEGATVRIGPLAGTQMACTSPEGVDAQEAGYFAALESARRFEQVGDELTLLDSQGRMAVTFKRA